MKEQLVECQCCGEMVPASNMELTFRRPDVIAALSEEERDERCKHDDDSCELDGNRFFIRGLVPLPVQESAQPYCLGAWVEISKSDFKKVEQLWNDGNQADEKPISGVLANEIPLTEGTKDCVITLQLTGPKSRPDIMIVDEACSLHREQECGINIHRAREYSEVFTKKEIYSVVEEEELDSRVCSCCDNKIRVYCGYVSKIETDSVIADYWFRIPEGHGGYFTIAVSIEEGGEPRVAVLLAEATSEDITYWIQNKEDSPWEDFGDFGNVMDRDEVLADSEKGLFFDMVDKIAASDSRLKQHIERHQKVQ